MAAEWKKRQNKRKQGESRKKKWESVSFPLFQSRPLTVCCLLLPHSLYPLQSHSRRCCCGGWKPLPSPLTACVHTLSHSAYMLRRRGQTNGICADACGAVGSRTQPLSVSQSGRRKRRDVQIWNAASDLSVRDKRVRTVLQLSYFFQLFKS